MVLCDARATLPDFVVTLGGKKFTVTPFDYIIDVSLCTEKLELCLLLA
jgi:hypothetical protein